MTKPKLCKDCFHCDKTEKNPSYWKCRADSRMEINLVTGNIEPTSQYFYCETGRKQGFGCGPEGSWFVPVERLTRLDVLQ